MGWGVRSLAWLGTGWIALTGERFESFGVKGDIYIPVHRWKAIFTQKTDSYKPHHDHLNSLSRPEQSTIFRLRTGLCGLRAHLKKIGIAESSMCDCLIADQTLAHVLQDCTLHKHIRKQIWPMETTLEAKLWGTAADLRRTVQFVTSTGLKT